MLFSSTFFLYIYLPIAIILVLLAGKGLQNIALVIVSLFFCAWGGATYSLIMLGSILVNYVFGLLVGNYTGTRKAHLFLAAGIILNIGTLIVFKYLNFFADNINSIFNLSEANMIHLKKIVFPLAISYYTFHCISYLLDIYRQKASAQKNIINLSLYISFFPKLIAGPIIRYNTMAGQIESREITYIKFADGAERFVIGLAKKVLLANTFAFVADKMFALPIAEHSLYSSWLGLIAYSLQIYFDFSAYSDMAIGLAKIFGFDFPENFNFPYISRSIQDFWHRWHISLSEWLREYLFTPLSIKFRNAGIIGICFSLILTFGLCGLWHGPGWTYIAWGLLHGVFLAIESLGFSKILKRLWSPLRHIYVLIIVLAGWVLFRSDTFEYARGYFNSLIGLGIGDNKYALVSIYLTNEFLICAIIAVIGSTRFFPFIKEMWQKISVKFPLKLNAGFNTIFLIVEIVGFLLIMTSATMYIVTNSYNPFIYFRF